jgi:hypothetical protein
MSGIMYQACASSTIATDDVVLTVNGEVEQSLKLSLLDLSRFSRGSVRAKDELGRESLFEGVPLIEILCAASPRPICPEEEKGISPIIEIREAFAVLFAACRELRELPRVM